jgi:hypothetical protein
MTVSHRPHLYAHRRRVVYKHGRSARRLGAAETRKYFGENGVDRNVDLLTRR